LTGAKYRVPFATLRCKAICFSSIPHSSYPCCRLLSTRIAFFSKPLFGLRLLSMFLRNHPLLMAFNVFGSTTPPLPSLSFLRRFVFFLIRTSFSYRFRSSFAWIQPSFSAPSLRHLPSFFFPRPFVERSLSPGIVVPSHILFFGQHVAKRAWPIVSWSLRQRSILSILPSPILLGIPRFPLGPPKHYYNLRPPPVSCNLREFAHNQLAVGTCLPFRRPLFTTCNR